MVNKLIIDAKNAVLGRLCSYAAKQALQGNDIIIVNTEKAIITGTRQDILDKFRKRKARGGASQKGPKYPRKSFMIVKRAIRGMLPDYRWGEGKAAFSRIRCFEGIPQEFAGKEMETLNWKEKTKFIELNEISKGI